MKNYIPFFLLLFSNSINTNGQLIPEFQTQLYFEDADGNRDTVNIGMDSRAVFEETDIDFGEIVNNSPFSNPFEVRAGAGGGAIGWWSPNYSLYQDIIINAELNPFNGCKIGEPIIFFIHTKAWPVTVKWDRVFHEDCFKGTFMTPDYLYEMTHPMAWFGFDWIRFSCLNKQDSFIVDIPNIPNPIESTIYKMHPVKDSENAKDTIWGVFLIFLDFEMYSACSLISSIEEIGADIHKISNMVVAPNPATVDIELLGLEDVATDIWIYDMQGSLIKQVNTSMNRGIDVSALIAGYYVVVAKQRDKYFLGKFVKQ